MDQLVQRVKVKNNWIHLFETYNRKNNLVSNPITRLQDPNIQSLTKHLKKISQQNGSKHIISWVSSQYQALEIVLNSISAITEKTIEDFTTSEWALVYNIFPYKLPLTVKYENLRIIQDKKQTRRRWCASEQIFLIGIVRRSLRKNKWNDVARQLFIKSEGEFFRQGKHCRERWLNHLNPQIQNSWTNEEDVKILSLVLKKGKKWAQIAKKLNMRKSECMIKKRFYELVNIRQEGSISPESIKNSIKQVLNQIRSRVGEGNSLLKSTEKFQIEVDKIQRKQSSIKESNNIKVKEEAALDQEAGKGEEKIQESVPLKTTESTEFHSVNGLGIMQNYFTSEFAASLLNPGVLSWYQNYNGFLGVPANSLFMPYTQLIVPIQNNIVIHQINTTEREFPNQ